MSIGSRNAVKALREELAFSDHLPVCPDCGDLSAPGSTVCESCAAHLMVSPRRSVPVLLPDAPHELCPTDLHAYDADGFCDCCGRQRGKAA